MIRTTCLLLTSMTAACAIRHPQPAMQPSEAPGLAGCTRDTGTRTVDPSIDTLNPAFFVSIYEVTSAGQRIPISLPEGYCPGQAKLARAHVDYRSRIEIRFVRPTLETVSDLSLMVRGELHSGTTRSAIEIPGYSRVEEGKTPAAATARSLPELRALVSGLSASTRMVEVGILNAQELVQIETYRALSRRIEELQLEAVRLDEQLRAVDTTAPAIAADLAGGAEAFRDATALTARRDSLRTKLEENARQRRSVEESLANPTTAEHFLRAIPRVTPDLRARLLERRALIEAPLRALMSAENREVVETLAQRAEASPDHVITMSRLIVETWIPELERSAKLPAGDQTDDRLRVDFNRVKEVEDGLREIGRALGVDDLVAVRRTLLAGIRNTDIVLSSTTARPGDAVLLRITNGEGRTRQSDLIVRLEVSEYGLRRAVGEAFALVDRPGVDAAANQHSLDSLRHALQARSLDEPLMTSDSVQTIQQPHRWAPAYSFVAGWVYRHRPANPLASAEGKARWHNLIHWLEPSFGLQVALPNFGTELVTFRRQVTDGDESTNQPPSVFVGEPERTTVDRGLDVAVGGYVGLWNNLVTVGLGRHLTAERPNRYYSVGLSFVRIAQAAVQSLSN